MAIVISLTVIRTIYNWTVSCVTDGSPKVVTALFLDGVQRNSVTRKRTTMSEPILPYSTPKTVQCVAANAWGSDMKTLSLGNICFFC